MLRSPLSRILFAQTRQKYDTKSHSFSLRFYSRLDSSRFLQGASEYSTLVFGSELAKAVIASSASLAKLAERESLQSSRGQESASFHEKLSSFASLFWTRQFDEDIFGPR